MNALRVTGKMSWLFSFIILVVFAQIKAISSFATFFVDLLTKEENWWVRAIIIVVTLGVIAVGYVLSKLVRQYFEKSKEDKDKKDTKQGVEEVKALTEPIKEDN